MTVSPILTHLLEQAKAGVQGMQRLLPGLQRVERRADRVVEAQAGPELRLSLIAICSAEFAALEAGSPGAGHLWTILYAQRDRDTGKCRAWITRLMQLTGSARGTINGYLRTLERGGWVKREYERPTSPNGMISRRPVLVTTPSLPEAVRRAEAEALARGKLMAEGSGDDVVSRNLAGHVELRRAIIPLPLLCSERVRAMAASGKNFAVWLFMQAQTWARGVRMSQERIARKLHLLSPETKRGRVIEGWGNVRNATKALRALGLLLGGGKSSDIKLWSTPETLHLSLSDRRHVEEVKAKADEKPVELPPTSNRFVDRLLQEWMHFLDEKGVLSARPVLTPMRDEVELARRMVDALDVENSVFPDDPQPLWLSEWWTWVYSALAQWKGQPPWNLVALYRKKPPDWLPIA